MSSNENWKRSGHITGNRPDTRGLPVDESVEREVQAYMEMCVEDLVAEGWDPEDAMQEAIRRFGNPDRISSESKEIAKSSDRKLRLSRIVDEIRQDTIYALRTLWKAPGFAAVAVLILAIGIGANVAIFSMLKGIILRPMPFPDPDRIVAVWETEKGRRWYQPFTSPDYYDMLDQNSSFEEFGIYTFRWANVMVDNEPERVRGVITTASILRALEMPPLYGRLFGDDEESEDRNNIVILGYDYWKRRFHSDPGIIGERIILNRESYEVVGIMSDEFEFPSPWGRAEDVTFYCPYEFSRTEGRGSHWLASLGRLKDGVTVEQAEADLKVIAANLSAEYPDTNTLVDVWIDPLMRRALGGLTGTLISLLIVVGFVLLIGCANIASMLLARGAARQTEVAIRASLGAGGHRIIRQLLTESMLLSILGGIGGVLLALWSLGTLKGLLPPTIPRIEGIIIDGWVLFFAFIIMSVTGIIFGLAPALFAARTNLAGTLAGGGGSRTGGRRRNRMLSGLVIVQLAVALMLVNAAILLFVSFVNVTRVPQGFDTENILIVSLETTGTAYEETQSRFNFWDLLLARVGAAPGVVAVGATTKLPTRGGTNGSVLVDGEIYDQEVQRPLVELSYVTPGYFEAMGIDLIKGRTFESGEMIIISEADEFITGLNGITVVNQAFVDRYWTEVETEPIGQVIRQNSAVPQWSSSVIGITEDARQWGMTYPTLPERYVPFSLTSRMGAYLVMRTERDPNTFISIVREAVREIDPLIPVDTFWTMEEMVRQRMQGARVTTLLIGLFTIIAVLLATAGTYGVMSFRVTQRTQEIGIRVAFGASRKQIVWHFIRQGLRLTLVGGGVGVWCAISFMIILSSQIFGIQAAQLLYLLVGILLLAAMMFMATALPAMRATRVDPVKALQSE